MKADLVIEESKDKVLNETREAIEPKVKSLMLSVSANPTLIHFGHKHACLEHRKIVDKDHIDECSFLQGAYPPRHFNDMIKGIALNNLPDKTYNLINKHYKELLLLIDEQETKGNFIPIKDCF